MRMMVLALVLMASGCAGLFGQSQPYTADPVDDFHAQQAREMRAQLAAYENDPSYLECKAKLANPATADDERTRCRDFYYRWTTVIDNQRALVYRNESDTAAMARDEQLREMDERAADRRETAAAIQAGVNAYTQQRATTTTNCSPDGLGGVRCVSQ